MNDMLKRVSTIDAKNVLSMRDFNFRQIGKVKQFMKVMTLMQQSFLIPYKSSTLFSMCVTPLFSVMAKIPLESRLDLVFTNDQGMIEELILVTH